MHVCLYLKSSMTIWRADLSLCRRFVVEKFFFYSHSTVFRLGAAKICKKQSIQNNNTQRHRICTKMFPVIFDRYCNAVHV